MLTHFRLKNIRSLADVSMSLSSGPIAFVGRNGAGKTNLLQSFSNWAISTREPSFIPQIISGPVTSQEHFIEAQLNLDNLLYRHQIRWKLGTPKSGTTPPEMTITEYLDINQDNDWHRVVTNNNNQVRIASSEFNYAIPNGMSAISILNTVLDTNSAERVHIDRIHKWLNGVKYYPLTDSTIEHQPGFHIYQQKDVDQWAAAHANAPTSNENTPLRLLYLHEYERATYDEIENMLGPKGMGLLTSILFHSFKSPTDSPDEGASYLLMFVPGHGIGGEGRPFTFQGLSAGTRRTIQIITSLLADSPTLMLMEQPEDCMHTSLLHKVIDTIGSYSHRTQTFFSTHSTTLLNRLQPEQLRLVTAHGGDTTVRKLTDNEITSAIKYLSNEGELSDFLELL